MVNVRTRTSLQLETYVLIWKQLLRIAPKQDPKQSVLWKPQMFVKRKDFAMNNLTIPVKHAVSTGPLRMLTIYVIFEVFAVVCVGLYVF